MDIMDEANECYGYLFVTLLTSVDNLQALQSVVNASHHAEAEAWTHYSDTSWRLTLAVYLSANNVQAVYRCLQVSTRGSSSDRNVCSVAASTGDLMVPRTRAIMYGSRSFAESRPRVWNDLPPTLHSSSTTLGGNGQFQSRLKITLFRLTYGMSWHFRDCLGC